MNKRHAARLLFAAFAAWLIALAQWLSAAGIGFSDLLASLAGSGIVLALCIVAASRTHDTAQRKASLLGAAVVVAAQAGIIALFVDAQTPRNPLLRVRFAISEAAFERAAANGESVSAHWIGLFRIERIESLDGETRLITGGCGIVDRCGFARRAAPAPERGKVRYRRLGGDWYLLYDVF